MIDLYTWGTPNGRKVSIMLEETGLSYRVHKVDISKGDQFKPDFVAISFYKMFGYPTGTGALIARKDALARLERPWFAGGTITLSSVSAAYTGSQYAKESFSTLTTSASAPRPGSSLPAG